MQSMYLEVRKLEKVHVFARRLIWVQFPPLPQLAHHLPYLSLNLLSVYSTGTACYASWRKRRRWRHIRRQQKTGASLYGCPDSRSSGLACINVLSLTKSLTKILPTLCVTMMFVLPLQEQEFHSLCLHTVYRREQHQFLITKHNIYKPPPEPITCLVLNPGS